MIEFTKGNIFHADVEAIVNPVNTVGVMGKGLALQFKQRYPRNFRLYADACSKNEVRPGEMFVTLSEKDTGPQGVINFPTKDHWADGSNLQSIIEGLIDLREVIINKGIKSIAIPALGAGLGGLYWEDVEYCIVNELQELEKDVRIVVYRPL